MFYDDPALINRLKRQEPGSFDDFMACYKHRLYAFIYHHVRNEDVTYDLLQDTCMKVYQHIRDYDSGRPFTTWLFAIAINLCRSHGRKARLRAGPSLDKVLNENGATYHDTLADNDPSTEDIVAARRQLHKVSAEIEKLPHKLKSALIAFAVDGNSQEESARMLGITPKTLETRVYRARKILTDKLAKRL